MADYVDKSVADAAFMAAVRDVVKQHAPEAISKRYCPAADAWRDVGGDFGKLLDIRPLNGNGHPIKISLLAERNGLIFEASVLLGEKAVIKSSKIPQLLVNEILAFEPIFKIYPLKKPNRCWSDVEKVLFQAFVCHFKFKEIPFPSDVRHVGNIIKKCHSAKKLRDKNNDLIKCSHGHRISKKNV